MTRSQTKKFAPRIEVLEDRYCPTSVSFDSRDGLLEIQGDNGVNTVSVLQNDAANTLTVTFDINGGTATNTFTSSAIRRIEIDLEGGSDSVGYDLASNFTFAKDIYVETNSGLDRVRMNMGQVLTPNGVPTGGTGTIQARLDIAVDSGDDADRVWVDVGAIAGATVDIDVELDDGNDELNAGVWGDLSGIANVNFDARGESGNDILRFAGRYDGINREFKVDIASGATLTVDMDGGGGTDLVRASMINGLLGRLNVLLDGGSGNDRGLASDGVSQAGVSASISLLSAFGGRRGGILDARLFGNTGDDAMGFELQRSRFANATILNALLDGGDGSDTRLGIVSPGVTVLSVL